jgi:hypothetical protein
LARVTPAPLTDYSTHSPLLLLLRMQESTAIFLLLAFCCWRLS